MNRDDIVTYVTTKAQMVQPDDVTACQLFVSKRYELIYNAYLWKDSLTMVNVSVDPVNNPDNANGIVLLPAQIDRVVAVRTQFNSVKVHGLEDYYRIDYDAFNAGTTNVWGSAAEFAILNPIWAAIQPTLNPYVSIAFSGTYDDSAPPYGVLTDANIFQGSVMKFIAGANDHAIQNGPLTPQGETVIFSVPTQNLTFVGLQNQDYTGTLYGFAPSPKTTNGGAGATVTLQSTANEPTAVLVKVTWRDRTDRYVLTAPLPITLTPTDGQGYIELESVFKPANTAGDLGVFINNVVAGSQGNLNIQLDSLLRIPAASSASAQYQRIRLFSVPNQALTLNVLGKKPFTPLTFPTEVPAIKNLDNTLIAFALGDMLQRARQFGKAQSLFQEGQMLLQELAKLETIQAANNTSFKPDNGYGDAYFSPTGGLSVGGFV